MKTSLHSPIGIGNEIPLNFLNNRLAYSAAVALDDPALAPWREELPARIAGAVSRVRAKRVSACVELALSGERDDLLPSGHADIRVHQWAAARVVCLPHEPDRVLVERVHVLD